MAIHKCLGTGRTVLCEGGDHARRVSWRTKVALGVALIVVGGLGALFMTGWILFTECDASCQDDRPIAYGFVVAALAVVIGGVLTIRRGLKDRRWSR